MGPGRILYRIALRLLPRNFRERNELEMRLVLAEQLAATARWRRGGVWVRVVGDVLKQAVVIRWRVLMRGSGGHLDGLLQDTSHAVRALVRRPGFTALGVAVLALGIGATTTVFTTLDGILLRPLPYEASARIGVLWHDFGEGAQSLPLPNPLDLYDYRDWSETFERFTLGAGDDRLLEYAGDARIVDVAFVEAGFFEFFGVQMSLGRSIRQEDVVKGARSGLIVLVGAVGLFFLVACANVSILLLARVSARGTEFSLRSALGANRLRVVRLVLLESLVLAAAGATLGMALAFVGVRSVRILGRESLPRLDAVMLDFITFGSVTGVLVGSALLACWMPARRAARIAPLASLSPE